MTLQSDRNRQTEVDAIIGVLRQLYQRELALVRQLYHGE